MRLLVCVSVAVCVSLLGRSGTGAVECQEGSVKCGDIDMCVETSGICNGDVTCFNGWDELHCTRCQGESFMCDESRCVTNLHRCDGVTWCRDGTDEANCTSIKDEPYCSASSKCNGNVDCWTWDDELHCTPDMCQAPATKETYFEGICRDPNERCNGEVNFRGEKDEDNCTECNGGAFFCDGRCIAPGNVCDGWAQCANGADELNCTSCQEGSFMCDGSRCVFNDHKCDGVTWCRDGTDEANCTSIKNNTFCEPYTRCNGQSDCWTFDDELLCTPDMCQAPATKETYSGGRCREPSARCNGVVNFRDEYDEDNCTECIDGAFFCAGRCLDPKDVCDGKVDCLNGADELNCTSCNKNSFLCDESRCVNNAHKCDGVVWCSDGTDEANCTKISSRPQCSPSSRCNGKRGECWTDDDELLCTPDMCQSPATKEAYSGGRCRDPNARCNGVVNFEDEKDEDNCTGCNGGAFFCNGRCLASKDICDGWAQCSNGEDELNCTSCKEGSLLCDGSRCVNTLHKCDGVPWCRDGTDEANCTSLESYPFCPASLKCNGKAECFTRDDELLCTPDMCQEPATSSTYCDGRCLDESSWCDGVVDCADGQDEARCSST